MKKLVYQVLAMLYGIILGICLHYLLSDKNEPVKPEIIVIEVGGKDNFYSEK